MKHVAVDSDIFFFSIGQDKRDRNVLLASSLLEHIDNHPELELCVPFSVLAETVFKTLTSEKESTDPNRLEHITALIELWRKLEIKFLLPSNEAAETSLDTASHARLVSGGAHAQSALAARRR